MYCLLLWDDVRTTRTRWDNGQKGDETGAITISRKGKRMGRGKRRTTTIGATYLERWTIENEQHCWMRQAIYRFSEQERERKRKMSAFSIGQATSTNPLNTSKNENETKREMV